MGFYEKHLLPKLLNLVMKNPDMLHLRKKLVPLATGKVLEIGIGSGLNIPLYRNGVQVTGVDPSIELLAYARALAADTAIDVEFIAKGAEEIPLADNTFDSAVVTWTLCTIPDPMTALLEIKRVLKPEGRLLFVEHGSAPEPEVVKWQDRVDPLWSLLAGGCHINRRPDKMMVDAGFRFEEIERRYIKGPRIMTFNYQGIARHA
ncbi:MAG: ubiquinone/menaquinone biosynthesis C-methylase UbiE [Candidatus Azotimanducaceae bacterium]|jgi:ubiquinone/menaquinone biosynthesis C-methylase UbiE